MFKINSLTKKDPDIIIGREVFNLPNNTKVIVLKNTINTNICTHTIYNCMSLFPLFIKEPNKIDELVFKIHHSRDKQL